MTFKKKKKIKMYACTTFGYNTQCVKGFVYKIEPL